MTTRRAAPRRSVVPRHLTRIDAADDARPAAPDHANAAPSLSIYMLASFRVVVNGEEINDRLGGKSRYALHDQLETPVVTAEVESAGNERPGDQPSGIGLYPMLGSIKLDHLQWTLSPGPRAT